MTEKLNANAFVIVFTEMVAKAINGSAHPAWNHPEAKLLWLLPEEVLNYPDGVDGLSIVRCKADFSAPVSSANIEPAILQKFGIAEVLISQRPDDVQVRGATYGRYVDFTLATSTLDWVKEQAYERLPTIGEGPVIKSLIEELELPGFALVRHNAPLA